jgi:hypothetical protein
MYTESACAARTCYATHFPSLLWCCTGVNRGYGTVQSSAFVLGSSTCRPRKRSTEEAAAGAARGGIMSGGFTLGRSVAPATQWSRGETVCCPAASVFLLSCLVSREGATAASAATATSLCAMALCRFSARGGLTFCCLNCCCHRRLRQRDSSLCPRQLNDWTRSRLALRCQPLLHCPTLGRLLQLRLPTSSHCTV